MSAVLILSASALWFVSACISWLKVMHMGIMAMWKILAYWTRLWFVFTLPQLSCWIMWLSCTITLFISLPIQRFWSIPAVLHIFSLLFSPFILIGLNWNGVRLVTLRLQLPNTSALWLCCMLSGPCSCHDHSTTDPITLFQLILSQSAEFPLLPIHPVL